MMTVCGQVSILDEHSILIIMSFGDWLVDTPVNVFDYIKNISNKVSISIPPLLTKFKAQTMAIIIIAD